MGVLFDYFSAPSDEAAAATLDRLGGPGSRALKPSVAQPGKRGPFGWRGLGRSRSPQLAIDDSLPEFDTVSAKGIDPVVQMGTLEELLTGRPYDEIVEDPRSGKDLASSSEGQSMVLTLTQNLTSAVAAASDERLAEVAVPWSQTEEFWGQGDPRALTDFLRALAALARRADGAGQRLYCWMSL